MKIKYLASAVTDIGAERKNNQDSACIKVAQTRVGDMAMAVICDGMGGLKKGEVASAEAVKSFEEWFHDRLPELLEPLPIKKVAKEWGELMEHINSKLWKYSLENSIRMGTTVTAIFFYKEEYVIAHIGDSRVYRLGFRRELLTTDHTLVEKEVSEGTLTREQAIKDRRRHILWQCVGASSDCKPDIIFGKAKKGDVFLLCTDGFYHRISGMELCDILESAKLINEKTIRRKISGLIKCAMERGEEDNITAVLIKLVREC